MLPNKVSLGKIKKIEIIRDIISYHNSMRLEINYKKKKTTKKHKHVAAKEYGRTDAEAPILWPPDAKN